MYAVERNPCFRQSLMWGIGVGAAMAGHSAIRHRQTNTDGQNGSWGCGWEARQLRRGSSDSGFLRLGCASRSSGNQYKAVNAAVGTFLLVSTGTWSDAKRTADVRRALWTCGLSTSGGSADCVW